MHSRNTVTAILIVMVFLSALLYYKVFDFQHSYLSLVSQIQSIETSINTRFQNMQWWLEGRINKVSQSQDEYQISTSKRIDALECRVKKLEQEEETSPRRSK